MKKYFATLFLLILIPMNMAYAHTTKRIAEFSNAQVAVWKTVIYPNSKQRLAMHRHEYNRVMVALSDGVLKITNDKGKTHYMKLEKNKAYYLTKDIPNELHMDENITRHPISVMVIELKENQK
ncbi:MAG: hypothetical protein Q8R79_07085 [Legionellaceae bacterium]|nr:hypothetical protein [Legionellaceae bacterium]